jgi:hypothetical protein
MDEKSGRDAEAGRLREPVQLGAELGGDLQTIIGYYRLATATGWGGPH